MKTAQLDGISLCFFVSLRSLSLNLPTSSFRSWSEACVRSCVFLAKVLLGGLKFLSSPILDF